MKREIRKRVYVSVGSHGKPFMFDSGVVADRYPTLLWVFNKRLTKDLIPATLVYKIESKLK